MARVKINGKTLVLQAATPPWRLVNLSTDGATVFPPGPAPSMERMVIVRANTEAKSYYTMNDGVETSVFTTQGESPGLAVLNNPTTVTSNSALLVLLSLDDAKLYVLRLGARARRVFTRHVQTLRKRQQGYNSEVYRIEALEGDEPIRFTRQGYVPEVLFQRVQQLHDAPVVVAAAGQSGKPWHAPDMQLTIHNPKKESV